MNVGKEQTNGKVHKEEAKVILHLLPKTKLAPEEKNLNTSSPDPQGEPDHAPVGWWSSCFSFFCNCNLPQREGRPDNPKDDYADTYVDAMRTVNAGKMEAFRSK